MNNKLIDGVVSIADAEKRGITRSQLAAMCASGEIERLARGIYAPCGYASENGEIEILARRGCSFVVALESALRFHGFATPQALDVTVAMKRGARKPAVEFPLRVVRLAPASLEAGVEEHEINGCKIQVFCPAKTVADLFMYRNKLGFDLAKQALRDGYNKGLFTIDELTRYAAIDRVTKTITPYIEAFFL